MGEPDVSGLITVEQAMSIVDSAVVEPRVSNGSLLESRGLFLAADLRNDRDAPPFDKSLMDGFAVRAEDLGTIPCELAVIGTVAAGGVASTALGEGQAIAIMTGAPMPAGADAVVPIEATRPIAGSNRIRINEAVLKGRYTAVRGSDAAAGAIVLKAGTRLGPAQIAVAASIGAAKVLVFEPPKVAILGTGDELVSIAQTPTGSQIRSCNNPMLDALLANYPCRTIDLGIVGDDPRAIEGKIAEALSHDIVLITGGMSMGERDFVPEILRRLGGNLKITKLRIKPGKPFVFAEMRGGKFAFGLPGNPVSAFVCTICLVSRLMNRMGGGPAAEPTRTAVLAQPLEGNGPRTFYLPAIFDGRSLTPLRWKGSADIYTLSQANALVIRPENQPARAAGAEMAFIGI